MTKKIKEFENWLDEMTNSFAEEPMFNTKEEEKIEITCCGIEITDEIRDNDLCPKCLEHL